MSIPVIYAGVVSHISTLGLSSAIRALREDIVEGIPALASGLIGTDYQACEAIILR